MSFLEKSVRSFFWNHLGKVSDYGLAYLLSILFARSMGIQEYGVYVVMISISAVGLNLIAGGFDEALIKFSVKYSAANERGRQLYIIRYLLAMRIVLSSLMVIAILVFNDVLAESFNTALIKNYALILAAYVVTQGLYTFFTSLLIAQLKTRLVFFISFTVRIVNIILCAIMLHFDYGLKEILITLVVSASIANLVLAYCTRYFFSGETEKADINEVTSFGFVLMLNSFITLIYGRYATVLMLSHFSGQLNNVALFDIAFSLEVIIEYIFAMGFAGLSLSLTTELATRNYEKLQQARNMVMKYYQTFIIPAGLFSIFFAGPIIDFIYGPSYAAAAVLFQIFLSINIFSITIFGRDFNSTILFSIGKEKVVLGIRIAIGLVCVFLNILLIPKYGVTAAAVNAGLVYFLTTLTEYIAASRYIGSRYDFFFVFKVLSVSVAALLIVEVINWRYDLHVVISAAIYVIFVGTGYYLVKLHRMNMREVKQYFEKIIAW